MTAHQSTGVAVVERFTQDGYDWPTPHPAPPQPMAPYFRAQLFDEHQQQALSDMLEFTEHFRAVLCDREGLPPPLPAPGAIPPIPRYTVISEDTGE